MQSASTMVAFVESGEPFDVLKQLVLQACQDQGLMLTVVPLEYWSVHYRLQRTASEGETRQTTCPFIQAPDTPQASQSLCRRCLSRWRRSARV